jgi:putative flippase GtrA
MSGDERLFTGSDDADGPARTNRESATNETPPRPGGLGDVLSHLTYAEWHALGVGALPVLLGYALAAVSPVASTAAFLTAASLTFVAAGLKRRPTKALQFVVKEPHWVYIGQATAVLVGSQLTGMASVAATLFEGLEALFL